MAAVAASLVAGQWTMHTAAALAWTANDPAARVELEVGTGRVFQIDPSISDPGCR